MHQNYAQISSLLSLFHSSIDSSVVRSFYCQWTQFRYNVFCDTLFSTLKNIYVFTWVGQIHVKYLLACDKYRYIQDFCDKWIVKLDIQHSLLTIGVWSMKILKSVLYYDMTILPQKKFTVLLQALHVTSVMFQILRFWLFVWNPNCYYNSY